MDGLKRNKSPKVLVYQIGSLGDTIVSIPAYRAIRRHFGADARIFVLHNAPKSPRATPQQVLQGSGLIDGAIPFQQYEGRAAIRTFLQLWPQLLAGRFDYVVYVAPGRRAPSAVERDKTFFRLCGIPHQLGFHACDPTLFTAREANGRPKRMPHEAHMRTDRLRQDGIAIEAADLQTPLVQVPADEVETARAWIEQHRHQPGRPLVAICPGSNQPAKFWPRDRFIAIGQRFIDEYGYEPLVIGGPAEREAGEMLVGAWGTGVNTAGQFSVIGSAALIHLCEMLVGLDTGTTHLASAVGTPCVALFADRDPAGQWEPLGDEHIILRHEVPCGGCRLFHCSQAGHPCMTGLSVQQVWAAVERIQQRRSQLEPV